MFHVTALDAAGAVIDRKRFRRAGLQLYLAQLPKGCVVAMEACGSAHHWARLAMRLGHRAVLMSPQFILSYVKSNKRHKGHPNQVSTWKQRAVEGMREVFSGGFGVDVGDHLTNERAYDTLLEACIGGGRMPNRPEGPRPSRPTTPG